MNPNRYREALGGMSDLKNMLFLQVRGQSQIAKELEETKNLRDLQEVLYFEEALKTPKKKKAGDGQHDSLKKDRDASTPAGTTPQNSNTVSQLIDR